MFFKRKSESGEVYVVVNNSGSEYTPELPDGEYINLLEEKAFAGTVKDKACAILKKSTSGPAVTVRRGIKQLR